MEAYSFLAKIAEGAYGSVWRAVDRNTNRIVAVKKLKEPTPIDSEVRSCGRPCCVGQLGRAPAHRLTPRAPSCAFQEYEFAVREVRLLQSLRHMNVVTLLEVRVGCRLCPERPRSRDSGLLARARIQLATTPYLSKPLR